MPPTCVKAIRIEDYGGPETLRLGKLELPDPGPGEVRVKLRAAGLNFVDVHLNRGPSGAGVMGSENNFITLNG